MRRLVSAALYLVKTECQWRYLPRCFPPWQTVYYHFRRWQASGVLDRVLHALRRSVRLEAGRRVSPSTAIIDSQSVKTSFRGGPRSYDGGKKVLGRKRHILTDTMGLLLAVFVHPAGQNDSQTAPHVLARAQGHVPLLQRVYADEGYAGTPPGLVWRVFGWAFRLVRRAARGFEVLPKRWVVERTFAWFGGHRRLSKGYEELCQTSEAHVKLAAISLMLRRLHR